MKAIYKMNFNCGRQGSLQGTFVAKKEHVKILVDNKIEVYFGEVLGKHSEVYGSIEPEEIEMVSDDEKTVELFITNNLSSGYNPFEYPSINFEHEGIDDIEDMELLKICEIISNN